MLGSYDDDEIFNYVSGCNYGVICTRNEFYAFWDKNNKSDVIKPDPVHRNSGLFTQVGSVGDHPVCVSLMRYVIKNKTVLIIEPTSNVVNHDLIKAYFKNILSSPTVLDDFHFRGGFKKEMIFFTDWPSDEFKKSEYYPIRIQDYGPKYSKISYYDQNNKKIETAIKSSYIFIKFPSNWTNENDFRLTPYKMNEISKGWDIYG